MHTRLHELHNKQSMRNILHKIIISGVASGATRWALLKISRVAVMMMAGEVMIQHRSPWPELETYHRSLMPISVTQQILLEPCTLNDTVVQSKRRLGGDGNCNTLFVPLLKNNN